MGIKLHSYSEGLFVFHCPGCGYDHPFHVLPAKTPKGESWTFNGNLESPTFKPSLLVNGGSKSVCHLFVKDGQIQFLHDCFHSLKGQTVELPDY